MSRVTNPSPARRAADHGVAALAPLVVLLAAVWLAVQVVLAAVGTVMSIVKLVALVTLAGVVAVVAIRAARRSPVA